MTKSRIAVPSNRAAVRMCAVLIRAHRDGRIELGFQDQMRCREGLTTDRLMWPTRAVLAKLWREHNGWDLAIVSDQTEGIPDHVRAELSA